MAEKKNSFKITDKALAEGYVGVSGGKRFVIAKNKMGEVVKPDNTTTIGVEKPGGLMQDGKIVSQSIEDLTPQQIYELGRAGVIKVGPEHTDTIKKYMASLKKKD